MKKTINVTIDIEIARDMLSLNGYSSKELNSATEDEIFEKVLSLLDCYGVTCEISKLLHENLIGDRLITRFTLINVDHEKEGLVYGAWMQDFSGTLKEATQLARETEKANSNLITVAVIENGNFTPFQNIFGAKRLDVLDYVPSLDNIISNAKRSCEELNKGDGKSQKAFTNEELTMNNE